MKRGIVLVVVGIVMGALVMSALPSGAHPGGDRKLQRQINKLRGQTDRLKTQVSVLQDKTKFMTLDGFYDSLILSEQVVSFERCLPLEPAAWLDTEVVPGLTYLACDPAGSLTAEPTKAELQRFREFQRQR